MANHITGITDFAVVPFCVKKSQGWSEIDSTSVDQVGVRKAKKSLRMRPSLAIVTMPKDTQQARKLAKGDAEEPRLFH